MWCKFGHVTPQNLGSTKISYSTEWIRQPDESELRLENAGASYASRDHILVGPLWEVYHESRRCSRDTYPESYITK